MLAGKERAMLVVALLAGCGKLTEETYREKISSHLTTFADGELRVKEGHGFFWVIGTYTHPKTSASMTVLAKGPPENGLLSVEFRHPKVHGQAAVFRFRDNTLIETVFNHGTPEETRLMESKAKEIANAVYLAGR
jgi:hypothetical protein